MIVNGKKFGNAETLIDYNKKKITFNYNNKDYNNKSENFAFFCHNYYYKMGAILGIIIFYGLMNLCTKLIIWRPYDLISPIIMISIAFISSFTSGFIIMGYLSIIIHKFSNIARDNYPNSNAFTYFLKSFKTIDLEDYKEGFTPFGYFYDNIFICWKYDIVKFDYCFVGNNKIKKVYTKSIEKHDLKGEHFNYVAIFEFKKKISEGLLSIK